MASKIAQLVERVHHQTLAGKVPWEETERDGVYQASFPNYSIRYSSRPTQSSGVDYILAIYNEQGSIVEEVADPDLDEDDIDWEPYEVMKETYERARGQALGVEAAIDDILRYLDKR